MHAPSKKSESLGVIVSVAALSALIAFPTAAMAADYVEPAPQFSWAGPYVGIHGGGGWGEKIWRSLNGAPTTLSQSVDGALGGVQFGRNYDTGTYVYGYEVDFSLTGMEGSVLAPGGVTLGASVDWLATATGRIGVAPAGWERTLFYLKGGPALVQDTFSGTLGPTSGSRTAVHLGWIVGAGVEWAFADNWSLRAEYNYLDFRWDRAIDLLQLGVVVPPPTEWEADQPLQLVKIGLNYRY